MNRWEIEVQKSLLNSEKAALDELEKQYKRALRDINAKVKQFQTDIDLLDAAMNQDGLDDVTKAMLKSQKQSKIYQQQYQKALKSQVSGILDKMQGDNYSTIDKYLKECYETGYVGTMYDIAKQGIPIITPIDQAAAVKAILTDSKIVQGFYNRLGVDTAKLKKTITQEISRGIASGLPYSDIARNINNASGSGLYNAKRITRTEGHRIQQTSARDAQYAAKEKGADVVKQWDAALDARTRDSHARVDGEIRELDEKFSNGLRYPGDPHGSAAEVVNCRCTCDTRARWALDDDELQTLKDRAAYFGLDKTDNFEDYKEKYLKAAEKVVENSENGSIMKSEWDNDLTPRGQLPHIDEDDLYSYVAGELGVSEQRATEYTDAVMAFTDNSGLFTDVRKYQRGETLDEWADIEAVKAISKDAEEYIKVAPRWNAGETFRGVTISDKELASYASGSVINMGGMSSWSSKMSISADFAVRNTTYERPNSVLFHCETQGKGTAIRHLSVLELEDEVLCSKDAKYKVLRQEKHDDGIIHIFLEEVQ